MSKPETYTVTATYENATRTTTRVFKEQTAAEVQQWRERYRTHAERGSTTTITVK